MPEFDELRHRARRWLIRAQARIEAGAGDRWIPPLAAAVLAIVLGSLGMDRLRGLESSSDLAEYTQAIWLISEGYKPEASLVGDGVHLLSVRWSFILYPLGMLAKVFPTAKLLIVVQALALGSALIPLWLLARRVAKLRIGASLALILAYSLHPITHELATDGFHPESLAVPALIAMAYFGATKRWLWYWVMVAIVLSCRADLGLAVAMWGFVLLGDSERSAGLSTMGVGMVWALGLLLVVQPIVGEATVAGGQYGSYGDSFGDALLNVVRSPISFISDLFAFDNVSLFVGLLAPLLFLPLLMLRYFAPAIPLGAIYLVARNSDAAFAERGALLLAFAIIASAYALRRLGDMGVDRVFLDSRLLTALVSASVLLFVTSSPASPYEEPWTWSDESAIDLALAEAASLLEEGDAVLASPSILAVLAERPWLYPLDPTEVPSVAFANFRARAVLIDERQLPLLSDSQREAYAEGMAAQGYEIRIDDRENGVSLYFRP